MPRDKRYTDNSYTDEDLDAAVAAGALSPDAADALRAFVEQRRGTASADEERFRLLTGFNDIFVTIAIVLLVLAVAFLAGGVSAGFAGAAVAAISWGLAEYFTRRRRMALPGIALLICFVAGVIAAGAHISGLLLPARPLQTPTFALPFALPALFGAVAAYVHWRRFMVPITVAAGAVLALGFVVGLMLWFLPGLRPYVLGLLFLGGLVLFALAMSWDARDLRRSTRATDVAFWLHLAAAPLLIHPIFAAVGIVGNPQPDFASAGAAIGVYLVLALISLAVDRRAMLVSALVYVLYAMTTVFRVAGTVDVQFALAALVIGSLLLLLSAGWHGVRRLVMTPLPAGLRRSLPPV